MPNDLQVEVRGKLIFVSQPGTQFYAIYTKPTGQPELVLISSNATQDHQLRAPALAGRQRQGTRVGLDPIGVHPRSRSRAAGARMSEDCFR